METSANPPTDRAVRSAKRNIVLHFGVLQAFLLEKGDSRVTVNHWVKPKSWGTWRSVLKGAYGIGRFPPEQTS